MRTLLAVLLAAVAASAGQQSVSDCRKDNCLKPGPEIQVGHCYRVTATETFQEIACPYVDLLRPEGFSSGTGDFHGDCETIPNSCAYHATTPFDVPPKEIEATEKVVVKRHFEEGAILYDSERPYTKWDALPDCKLNREGPIPTTCLDTKTVHHRTCEDKSRFLLMSEDNRWHCLALGAKP